MVALPSGTLQGLLYVIVAFVVIFHPLAHNLHGLEIFQHNLLAALLADAAGQMVDLLAVGQRGACCFGKFTLFWHT